MDFPTHFRSGSVLLAPSVSDKWKLLESMVDAVSSAWDLSEDAQSLCLECVVAREQCVSTGMEAGIAVPHAAVEGLDKMVVSMAILPEGLDFESLDGKPAQIVVMILVPKHEKLIHLQTLTEVARRLGDATFRNDLLAAADPEDVIQLWS
ncbi:MAG: PTS sugar transporter subunit IIA [Planctomycetota bacterium]|nr:PTS sugar transporter subunit IIA [Planctomycetota bacterium]MDA1112883.1 PTS sugar transporter subunit IIA [Planctomycetota bacterium]